MEMWDGLYAVEHWGLQFCRFAIPRDVFLCVRIAELSIYRTDE